MATRRKYGEWSEDDLQVAISALRNNDHGLNACSRIYGIPKATLKRHADAKNLYHNGVKVLGRGNTFNERVENLLKQHILELERCFFGLTLTDVRKLAFDIAEELEVDHRFNIEKKIAGKKWYYNFMKRNPDLRLRQPEATSIARIQGFCEENVSGFFDLLEKLVDEHGFNEQTIYNVDKSGFSTIQKKLEKVVGLRGKTQIGGITSGERGINTTMVCCCSVIGHYVPPMIIFKRQRMNPQLSIDASGGSLVEVSESGYINTELFVNWLKHFQSHVHASKEKLILLLLDGHTTHSKNLAALNFAKSNYITLLQLPAHTTHRLQPLNQSFFKPLGSYYIREQTRWLRTNPAKKITQYQICGLLKKAYGEAATPNNAANGFEVSGIWPVNRQKFTISDFIPAANLITPALAQETTLTTVETTIQETRVVATTSSLEAVTDRIYTDPRPCTSKPQESSAIHECSLTGTEVSPDSKVRKVLKKLSHTNSYLRM